MPADTSAMPIATINIDPAGCAVVHGQNIPADLDVIIAGLERARAWLETHRQR